MRSSFITYINVCVRVYYIFIYKVGLGHTGLAGGGGGEESRNNIVMTHRRRVRTIKIRAEKTKRKREKEPTVVIYDGGDRTDIVLLCSKTGKKK